MTFEVRIKFLHKVSITKKIRCRDGYTAIMKALELLSSIDKDNVSAVLITDFDVNRESSYTLR